MEDCLEAFPLATLGASMRGFLRLANGPPSHDTFSRLFRQLASRPGEFHPQALLEPCLNLSVHTAPDVRP